MKRKKRVGGSRKADGGRIASLKASGGGDAEGDGRPMAPGPWRRPVKKRITLYLDADVQTYLAALAARKGVTLSELANDVLKRAIAILEVAK